MDTDSRPSLTYSKAKLTCQTGLGASCCKAALVALLSQVKRFAPATAYRLGALVRKAWKGFGAA